MARRSQPRWTLPGRITAAREGKNLSIADVSAQIGVSRVTLYAWEKGDSVPALLALANFTRLTDVSLDWLVTGDMPDLKPPPPKKGKT